MSNAPVFKQEGTDWETYSKDVRRWIKLHTRTTESTRTRLAIAWKDKDKVDAKRAIGEEMKQWQQKLLTLVIGNCRCPSVARKLMDKFDEDPDVSVDELLEVSKPAQQHKMASAMNYENIREHAYNNGLTAHVENIVKLKRDAPKQEYTLPETEWNSRLLSPLVEDYRLPLDLGDDKFDDLVAKLNKMAAYTGEYETLNRDKSGFTAYPSNLSQNKKWSATSTTTTCKRPRDDNQAQLFGVMKRILGKLEDGTYGGRYVQHQPHGEGEGAWHGRIATRDRANANYLATRFPDPQDDFESKGEDYLRQLDRTLRPPLNNNEHHWLTSVHPSSNFTEQELTRRPHYHPYRIAPPGTGRPTKQLLRQLRYPPNGQSPPH